MNRLIQALHRADAAPTRVICARCEKLVDYLGTELALPDADQTFVWVVRCHGKRETFRMAISEYLTKGWIEVFRPAEERTA